MRLPWWPKPEDIKVDTNPNGFYPPEPPAKKRQGPTVVHCHGCGDHRWTFTAQATLAYMAAHIKCPGSMFELIPAEGEYRRQVNDMYTQVAHTIGPRT